VLTLCLASAAVVPAYATTLEDISIEELAAASDLVVVGRIEHVACEPRGPAGQPGIHSRAVIRVSETWRGQSQTRLEVWVQGGRIGTHRRVVPNQAVFRQGEVVVLFAFEAGGGLWPTGMSRGLWAGSIEGAGPMSDLTVSPGGAMQVGLPLSELRSRVVETP